MSLVRTAVVCAIGQLALVGCGTPGPGTPQAVPISALPSPARTAREPSAPAPSASPRRLAHVTFAGNEAISSARLDAVVRVDKDVPGPGQTELDLFERDVLFLSALYFDNGYITAALHPERRPVGSDGLGSYRIVVDEGPRYRVGTFTIDEVGPNGKPITPLGGRPLRERVRLVDGDWFARGEIVRDLEAISSLYRDAGYATVEAEPQVELTPEGAIANLVVHVQRGPLVSIESVRIVGNARVPRSEIERAASLPKGALYGEKKLASATERIRALGRFDRVAMSTEQGTSPANIVVIFEVVEK